MGREHVTARVHPELSSKHMVLAGWRANPSLAQTGAAAGVEVG